MLYILRHGTTDWNVLRKLQGRTDIPLNEAGRALARKAAETYADVHFDVCYCSPMVRARETAEILLEGRNIPIIPDNRLREMSFGIYEGTEKCLEIPGCPVAEVFRDPANYRAVPEGESFAELFARTGAFLREVAEPELEKGKDVLIVGHGAMDESIVCQVKGLPLEEFWSTPIDNCGLIRLK